MPIDLDDRLHEYRDALDDAIEADPQRDHAASRRRLSTVTAMAAAAAVIAGVAGLAVVTERSNDMTVPAASPESASTPGSRPEGDTTQERSPTSGILSRFVLDDPDFVAIELSDQAHPDSGAVTFVTYLAVRDDGSLQTLVVFVTTDMTLPPYEGSRQVHGEMAWVSERSASVEVRWREADSTDVSVTLSPGLLDEALELAESVRSGSDADWDALIRTIETEPIPEAMQAWRDDRVAQGIQPVTLSTEFFG